MTGTRVEDLRPVADRLLAEDSWEGIQEVGFALTAEELDEGARELRQRAQEKIEEALRLLQDADMLDRWPRPGGDCVP